MDKRMSYNMRLLNTVITGSNDDSSIIGANTTRTEDERQELLNMMHKKSLNQRKEKIIPNIQRISDFTAMKLGLNSRDDMKHIESVKMKLQSINPDDVRDGMRDNMQH